MFPMVSKLRERVQSDNISTPSRLKERLEASSSPILQARQKKKAYRAYGEQKEAYGTYDKEFQEYTQSLKDWKSKEERSKEKEDVEQAYFLLQEKTDKFSKIAGKSYGDVDSFKENVKKQKEDVFALEKETEEKIEVEAQKQFKKAVWDKPTGVGVSEEVYNKQLGGWVTKNKDILGYYYDKSVDVLEGDVKLTEEQKSRVAQFKPEIERFSTYKGGGAAYSTKLLSRGPSVAHVTLGSQGQVFGIPYFKGEYEELDTSTFTITKRKGTLERFGSRGNPITSTEVISTRKLDVKDPFVKISLLKSPKFSFKGSFSGDVANLEKAKISKKLFKEQQEKSKSSDNFLWINPQVGKGGFVSRSGSGGFFTFKPSKVVKATGKLKSQPFRY